VSAEGPSRGVHGSGAKPRLEEHDRERGREADATSGRITQQTGEAEADHASGGSEAANAASVGARIRAEGPGDAHPGGAKPSKLAAAHLRKRYKARTVVHDVSLEVASGEVVGLLGPNGAGKTTCFYMIVGLVAADGGEISLDDESLSRLPIHRRARRGLSYLPQEASIFRKLTVSQNVRAILELQDLDADTLSNRLDALLEDLSISHLADAPAVSLSGGERRRVEIARARDAAALHPPRRAVRRCRSDRRPRHPEDHRLSQGTRHRGAHHRPQRPRDARHLRPGVHHQRRPGPRFRRAGRDCL
jgi:ABC-type glutathione transport system ATPase component